MGRLSAGRDRLAADLPLSSNSARSVLFHADDSAVLDDQPIGRDRQVAVPGQGVFGQEVGEAGDRDFGGGLLAQWVHCGDLDRVGDPQGPLPPVIPIVVMQRCLTSIRCVSRDASSHRDL